MSATNELIEPLHGCGSMFNHSLHRIFAPTVSRYGALKWLFGAPCLLKRVAQQLELPCSDIIKGLTQTRKTQTLWGRSFRSRKSDRLNSSKDERYSACSPSIGWALGVSPIMRCSDGGTPVNLSKLEWQPIEFQTIPIKLDNKVVRTRRERTAAPSWWWTHATPSPNFGF